MPCDEQEGEDVLPVRVQLNAWTGTAAAEGELEARAERWGSRGDLPHSQGALPLKPDADPADWSHPDVGFGVVLPDDDSVPIADRAVGADAPAPIRDLLAARPGAVVLRWRPDSQPRHIRRYLPDGRAQDPVIGLTEFGVGPARLPRYLLIVARPATIPWWVQYTLSTRHGVGRLPFDGDDPEDLDALDNYVTALLGGWGNAPAKVTAPLVWTVDHGGGDITSQMRVIVGAKLAAELVDPQLPHQRWVDMDDATGPRLLAELEAHPPAFLVTTSHGRTAPLDDAAQLAAQLGVPIDATRAPVAQDDLIDAIPAGAVWYAYACCSAGSDAVTTGDGPPRSRYAGLLSEGTSARAVVDAVAGLGPQVAPTARALLGRPDPVRAVLGHVEPTFDWTLRDEATGQGLVEALVRALGSRFHLGEPLGLALRDYRAGIGELHTRYFDTMRQLDTGDRAVRPTLTRLRLTAMDRQSLVLLGDPTVTLPPI